jgi:hypothetical protein
MIAQAMSYVATVVLAALAMLAQGSTSSARADGTVDLRLLLAVDASGSVNDIRFELQRRGYAEAFRHPRVLRAVLSGPHRAIAVSMMQWTGPALQVQVVPWMKVRDEASMRALADAIDAAPRRLFSGGTSISGAIDRGVRLLAESPFSAPRNVIDISGDGHNNRGRPATAARDEAVAAGVVINGLPILEVDPTLDDHYLQNVIGGPNSFMIPASSFDEFADAILRKLIIEIAGLDAGRVRVARDATKGCEKC